jgi:hypothetical protein
MCYPGHAEGGRELTALRAELATWDEKEWVTFEHARIAGVDARAPCLLTTHRHDRREDGARTASVARADAPSAEQQAEQERQRRAEANRRRAAVGARAVRREEKRAKLAHRDALRKEREALMEATEGARP